VSLTERQLRLALWCAHEELEAHQRDDTHASGRERARSVVGRLPADAPGEHAPATPVRWTSPVISASAARW